MSEDILTLPPPPAVHRLAYGSAPAQFGDLRLPKGKGPFPVVMNIHGGFWRNKYDLAHASHLCAALTARGFATWNLEYRRVGDPEGGWPGTFDDVAAGYRFVPQIAQRFHLNPDKIVVMGHSAGGQLALCLAAHLPEARGAISLAGVVDLGRGYALHLSHDAVAEFLGGTPESVPDHYRDADPMRLSIPHTRQVLLHGSLDDTVPPDFSRRYSETKKKNHEDVRLVEIPKADHYDLIDPRSAAWKEVEAAVSSLLPEKM